MSDNNWLNLWINEDILDGVPEEEQVIKINNNNLVLFTDLSDDNGFKDILIYQFHKQFSREKFNYNELLDTIEHYKGEKKLEVYVSFNNWEQERNVIQVLKAEAKSATKKNRIEKEFALFNSVYFSDTSEIKLKIENDGINYLDSPTNDDDLFGKVVNCSFSELKKLYYCTGTNLFRSNVRNGIISEKSTIKSVFTKYLSIEDIDEDSQDVIDDTRDYSPSLFWFSHNGITLFVDRNDESNFLFQSDTITLNPKFCNVINGAQTITNFFHVYSELKYQYRDEDTKLRKLDKLISDINVKLTIIYGEKKYSSFITKGLNTQNPITKETFVAISDEVMDMNKVLNSIRILKAGETERDGGMSPLQFVKQFLIASDKPGEGKNFDKDKLEYKIKDIHKEIVTKEDGYVKLASKAEEKILKMSFLPEIELWWDEKNKLKGKDKDLIDRYGKNYFESFVLNEYETIIDSDDKKVIFQDLFEDFVKLLSAYQLNYNSFKSDEIYNKIKENRQKMISSNDNSNAIIFDEKYEKYKKELLTYLKTNGRFDQRAILEFNRMKGVELENVRVIKRQRGRVKEHFHLSLMTFSELYQSLNIEDRWDSDEENKSFKEDEFNKFEESILYKELDKQYNIYILDIVKTDNGIELEDIDLKFDFNFKLLSSEKIGEVKRCYEDTVSAFVLGEVSQFPKARKENPIHVRPKAINKDDTFLFTNGENITKQTFWISRYYIEEILKKN